MGRQAISAPIEQASIPLGDRIVCPKAVVRLSAGREGMSREHQALCFLAGANSIFVGSRLLTTANPQMDADAKLFADLGLKPMGAGVGRMIAAE